MDFCDLENDFSKLKISAFSKYSKIGESIHNVTLGPNSVLDKSPIKQIKYDRKPKIQVRQTSPQNILPFRELLKEIDLKRQEKLQESIRNRFSKFREFSNVQSVNNQKQWLAQQQAFINGVKQQENRLIEALDQPDTKTTRNDELIQHYQSLHQRKMQIEQQIEQNREKQTILKENVDKIVGYQLEFNAIYQEIIRLVNTCISVDQLRAKMGESHILLQILPQNLEKVVNRARNYQISSDEVGKVADCLAQIKYLRNNIEDYVRIINENRPEIVEKSECSEDKPAKLDQFISPTNLKVYTTIMDFQRKYSELFQDLVDDNKLKDFRFSCKKAVNIPVNAISAVSSSHLKDKYVKLHNLLAGKTVVIADEQINAAKHPKGVQFCTDLLAKKFVQQSDLMVSANPEAAFCYATIIITLWNDFPDFGKLLLGYFYKQCPYLVPFYVPKVESQTTEEYYLSLGYRYIDGQIEKQDKFLKRMTGMMRLYFAILIARPKGGARPNPHNIKIAWKWLRDVLRLEPQLDITATSLHTFLETIGYEMDVVYGKMFRKLMKIIINYLGEIRKIDTGGPVCRLEVILQDYAKSGLHRPSGVLPKNFW